MDALGDVLSDDQAQEFLALNRAIDKLGEFNPRGRDVIQYRFFCGLSYDEIAEVMGLAAVTVRRSWTVARAWLRRELGEAAADSATQMLGVAES